MDRWLAVWASDKLLRGFGSLGLGELIVRFSRFLTAIVLARALTPAEFGIAASAITCFELIRILASNGLGQMVVRAPAATLDATCNAARRLIWCICIGMSVLQVAAGALVARASGQPELLAMTASLALVYLAMPLGMVQSWLLLRDQRMGTIASVGTAQIGADNLLAAAFALLGFGAWSIVAPKLLTAPIWLLAVRRAKPWRYNPAAGRLPMRAVLAYSAPVLASEVLMAIRFNADKLLVASMLGVEALGIYYFAFSAGYGLSIVLTGALTTASFPHLAETLSTAELLQRFDRALKRLALPICALVAVQAFAIVYYVPLLFGEKWQPYVPIVAVLCLSAATKPCFDLASQLLRAAGLPGAELRGSAVFTVVLLALFAAALPFGLQAGAIVIAIVSVTLQAAYAIWARAQVVKHPFVHPGCVGGFASELPR